MIKRAPWILALSIAACSGDRPPPEPPPDPTGPFEDPVATSGSGGVATTGPFMQNSPALVAKSTESVTANGGTLGTSSSSTSGHPPHAEQVPIPHGPVGVGGVGATTATLGSTGMGGRPLRSVTTDNSIR
ncbi:MAG TPA: hypothetical protein VI197_26580 [Polyangiaceae bacterium]